MKRLATFESPSPESNNGQDKANKLGRPQQTILDRHKSRKFLWLARMLFACS